MMTPSQKQAAITLATTLRGALDAHAPYLDDHLLIGALVAQVAAASGRLAAPLTDEQLLALWNEGRAAVAARSARQS